MPQITYDPSPDGYRPGACNIGPAEIARRRRAGWLGVVGAAALAAALVLLDAPAVARWVVALPLTAGAVGFLQAHFRFCVAYGMSGVRNLGALGSVVRVEGATARSADRNHSIGILLAAGVIGLAGSALFVVIPI